MPIVTTIMLLIRYNLHSWRTGSLLFIVLTIFSGGCGRVETGTEPAISPVAAEWRDHTITQDHFAGEYIYFSTYTHMHDRPESRDEYARLMLERMIIADRGRAARLDTLPVIRDEIQRRREMAMRRFLLEQKVQPDVAEPKEDEIQKAFDRANSRLLLQQIYAPDEETARQYQKRLRQGESFDRLSSESMRRAGLPPEHQSGMMGWVSFDELDETPEEVVFTLRKGEISEPVASLRGWHIFKLHDWQRTIHFDEMTYWNQRDALAHKVYQRRFDEASARFIRDIILDHELALDRLQAMALFEMIAPTLPSDGSPLEMKRYLRDLQLILPDPEPHTPVAWVDGQPYTVRQFLRQMPDIPVQWLQQDFRHAIEIAIRDSILAAKAMEIRADTARSVQFETGLAEYAGLYYATLHHVLDTLDFSRLPPEYYHVWKDEQFVDYLETDFIRYEFADSLDAIDAIRRFKETGDWEQVLQDTPSRLFEVRRLTRNSLEEYDLPVHRLPLTGTMGRDIIEGPFHRDAWVIIQVIDRHVHYLPYEKVTDQIEQLLRDRRMFVGHREALPAGYSRDEIIVHQEILDRALPYHYTGMLRMP